MHKRFQSPLDQEPIEEPLINLTPLIDVVFVILISFILIAPILEVDSVDLARGGPVEKKQLQSNSLSISVHKDNSIWYQNTRVSIQELREILKKEKKKNPHTVPQILHDQTAEFGTYQTLKNTLESVGFEQMDVILKPR